MKTDPFRTFPNDSVSDLSGNYRTRWVEETLVASDMTGNPYSAPRTKKYLGLSVSRSRLFFLGCFFALGVASIVFRVGYLALWNGSHYRSLAESNRLRVKPVPAERGILLDVFGRQLVQNVPSFSLTVTPQDVPRSGEARDRVVLFLAETAGESTSTIENFLLKYASYGYQSLTIKENLDYQSALLTYIESASYPGVSVESGTKRLYTDASTTPSLSHIYGYLGKLTATELENNALRSYLPTDSIGKTGLERSYESILRGKVGTKRIEVNATGKELSNVALDPPEPGKNLRLTIDLDAQRALEKAVRQAATTQKKRRISAIAMNPVDGAILAMVSWPAYDDNDFSGGIRTSTYAAYIADPDRPLFNRAISGNYPSGSIIKLIVAAAGLNEGVISPGTTVNSVGGIQVGPWYFRDWKVGGHGLTNVYSALAWSVNTFFYYVGGGFQKFAGLGVDRLVDYYHRFNLGAKTGIDLPGENVGLVPTPAWKQKNKGERWYVGDTYNISIGQGDVLVTPLQAAVWTSAIANGGSIVVPHLVQAIEDPITKIDHDITPPIARSNMVRPDVIQIVKAGARQCVTAGSCGQLRSLPFATGAKTGTAQWSSTKDTEAWFTAFAPYDNPKVVVTVLVEEGGEGSVAAMPIAKNFLEWWGKKYLTL